MSNKLCVACLMICVFYSTGILTAQSLEAKQASERTIFNEDEESFPNSAPMPKSVLNALLATREGGDTNRIILQNFPDKDPNQFFSADKVHLSSHEDVDYIVLGSFPLTGADCAWFWVVRSDKTHPKIILFANANSIELLKSRTNGFRNIRTVWSSASGDTVTHVYHYDGARYKLAHKFERVRP